MDYNTYIVVMRKENKMLIPPSFNRFISRMKEIWEIWDLLRKLWDSLDGFGRVSSEPAFPCECAMCIRRTHCCCHNRNTPCCARVRCHMYGWYGRHPVPSCYGKVYRHFVYTWEKHFGEKKSLAFACVWLPLPLNNSLIFYSGRCYGTAKVSQYTCCIWKYTCIPVYHQSLYHWI